MFEPYKYEDELFCEDCGADVPVKVVERTAKYWHDDKPLDVPYFAAVCSVCGRTLCQRDYDRALIRYVREHGG